MSSPNHNPVVMVSHENNINETEDILFVRKKKSVFKECKGLKKFIVLVRVTVS